MGWAELKTPRLPISAQGTASVRKAQRLHHTLPTRAVSPFLVRSQQITRGSGAPAFHRKFRTGSSTDPNKAGCMVLGQPDPRCGIVGSDMQ